MHLTQRGRILLSLGAALLLMLPRLPQSLQPFAPDWVAMVLLYWNLHQPQRVNIATSWVLGILLDLFSGSLLGQHALALVIMTYLGVRLHPQIRMMAPLLQLLLVTGILSVYRLILLWTWGVGAELPISAADWLPLLSSALIWPSLPLLLKSRPSSR